MMLNITPCSGQIHGVSMAETQRASSSALPDRCPSPNLFTITRSTADIKKRLNWPDIAWNAESAFGTDPVLSALPPNYPREATSTKALEASLEGISLVESSYTPGERPSIHQALQSLPSGFSTFPGTSIASEAKLSPSGRAMDSSAAVLGCSVCFHGENLGATWNAIVANPGYIENASRLG